MYTDDTIILISSSSIIDLMAEFVNILTQFSLWFCANKLALNDNKTKYVIFSSSVISHNDHTNGLVFDSHTVICSDFVCYLGIIIYQYLSWFEHINAVKNKLAKGVGMLHVIHNYVPSECLLSVCNAFVMPYLTYCIELWGNACTNLNPIQLLQKKFIRYIFNAPCLAHCKPLAKSIHALLFKDLYTLSVASLMYKAFHNR